MRTCDIQHTLMIADDNAWEILFENFLSRNFPIYSTNLAQRSNKWNRHSMNIIMIKQTILQIKPSQSSELKYVSIIKYPYKTFLTSVGRNKHNGIKLTATTLYPKTKTANLNLYRKEGEKSYNTATITAPIILDSRNISHPNNEPIIAKPFAIYTKLV